LCLIFHSTKNITLPPQECFVDFSSGKSVSCASYVGRLKGKGVPRLRRWKQIESASSCPWSLIKILPYLRNCVCEKTRQAFVL